MPPDSTNGGATSVTLGTASAATASQGVKDTATIWAEVYDEMRSHQSLSSVINDPNKGRGIFRGEARGLSEFWEELCESVEEIGTDQRESEADLSVQARTDAIIGAVPDGSDLQSYLDTFTEQWESYYRNHKAKGRGAMAGQREDLDEDPAPDVHQSVPREYLHADFKLEHHQIFRQSLATSVERQEELQGELTGHLDTVEVSLFEHIRRAQRDQLFDSLARLSEPLQDDLRSTLSMVAGLRKQLRSVQSKQLRCGMAVGRLARRKRRVEEVLQRLDCLAHVQQSQPSIQMLLQGQDYVTALDLLESTNAALESSLKGLVSAKPGAARLAGLTGTFDRVVEADFVHNSTEAIFAGGRGTVAGDPGAAGGELRGAERLRRLCSCLARRDLLKTTLGSTLRDVLLSQQKKVLKSQVRLVLEDVTQSEHAVRGKVLSSLAAEDQEDGETGGAAPAESEPGAADEAGRPAPASADVSANTGISAALCALSFEGFLAFWKRILRDCVDVAERFGEYIVLVHSASRDCISSAEAAAAADDSTTGASASEPNPRRGVSDCSLDLLRLFEVIVNSQLQKTGVLLQARQGEHRNLKAADWQELLKFTHETLDKVKALQDDCRRRLNPRDGYTGDDLRKGVRAIIYAQTKTIIEEFHQKRMAQMQLVVEQERWERTDVPAPYKSVLAQLLGREQQDVEAADTEQGLERYLHVEGLHFLVVPAVLTLMQLLNEYVQLCRDFDALAAEIVQRMSTLLRRFNQQTYELVLRAGAVSKQNLKRITASNLALSSQCCGLVAHILPTLQANLLSILDAKTPAATPTGVITGGAAKNAVAALVGDLAKVATEYGDHREKLYKRLSDLLRERYDVHSKKWLSTNHQDPAPGEFGAEGVEVDLSPHEALEGLVKDIQQMYKVLLKSLSGEGDNVKKIFAKAFEEMASKFEQRLGQELSTPTPPYEDRLGCSFGDRLARDVAFLQDQLKNSIGIATPLRSLLADLIRHLQTQLPSSDPLKALHPQTLEVLRRAGKLSS